MVHVQSVAGLGCSSANECVPERHDDPVPRSQAGASGAAAASAMAARAVNAHPLLFPPRNHFVAACGGCSACTTWAKRWLARGRSRTRSFAPGVGIFLGVARAPARMDGPAGALAGIAAKHDSCSATSTRSRRSRPRCGQSRASPLRWLVGGLSSGRLANRPPALGCSQASSRNRRGLAGRADKGSPKEAEPRCCSRGVARGRVSGGVAGVREEFAADQ